MAAHWDTGPRWGRWARAWLPVATIGAIWTVLTVPQGEVLGAALFFGICCAVGVAAARDDGSSVPWSVVPVAVGFLTSVTGPLFEAPGLTVAVGAAMTLTTPPARRLLGHGRAASLEQLSDWELDARWDDSEAQLRRTHRPETALAVVVTRAELLDELVRRGRPPDPGR